MFGIRRSTHGTAAAVALAGLSVFGAAPVHGQTPDAAPAAERRLTITDAVALALEQNVDLEVVRLNPQVQDLTIAQTRSAWAPSVNSSFQGLNQNSPPSSFLSLGQAKTTDTNQRYGVGFGGLTRWGASYSANWNNSRFTTNGFTFFTPQLNSTFQASYTQPLLRNLKIDNVRQQLQVSTKNREISDVQVAQTVATTTRSVKNAYWDLVFARDSLDVQRQSLDLAQRSLRENRARVEIGTMAPIDIVQAEAEVAQREEAVIVAEAAIERAEDRLRSLIYNQHDAAQWATRLVPTDGATFQPVLADMDQAVRAALDQRTDIRTSVKSIEANDVSIRFFRNQLLPDVSATLDYSATGLAGTQLIRDGFGPVTGQSARPWSEALKDVVKSDFPTWTLTVQMRYDLGFNNAEASLARARIQQSQAEKQLESSKIRVATEVRDAARTVTANAKRVEATRASRALAERRLEAEEKKFQAGMTTNFFVLQAQRDLNQARNNELQALIDHVKSVVDFETVQVAPLNGGAGVTGVTTSGFSSNNTTGTQQQRQ
ncbi:MAG: TolC family protein [Vicinamibacterales bacterium]